MPEFALPTESLGKISIGGVRHGGDADSTIASASSPSLERDAIGTTNRILIMLMTFGIVTHDHSRLVA